jgi:glyoxylase-like metal-dependent hydrolase (beta-lactamase superfamily II)
MKHGAMRVESVTIGMFAAQSHVAIDEASGACAIIDAGEDARGIETVVRRAGARPEKILLTHGHIDHAGGLAALRRAYPGVPILMNERDRAWVERLAEQGLMFGLRVEPAPAPDGFLEDGQVIEVGGLRLRTIFTPGHTEGGTTFFAERERVAFVGDTLFRGSVGRTDLPGGSFRTLLRSVRERLLPLGDDVVVYSGHGPKTTIGEERRENDFIQPGVEERIGDLG